MYLDKTLVFVRPYFSSFFNAISAPMADPILLPQRIQSTKLVYKLQPKAQTSSLSHVSPIPEALKEVLSVLDRRSGYVLFLKSKKKNNNKTGAYSYQWSPFGTHSYSALGCFIFDFFSQNVSFRPDSHYFIFLLKFGARYSLLKPIS